MIDPETTRAVAKAAEETANTTGKALDIVHDTGSYLRDVIGEVPADLVGVLGGAWLHERHIRLRDRLRRRTEQILRERDVQEAIELSPNMAAALIAGAQDESQEELAELFARLLANAMDPSLNNVRHSFIDAVKNMDPPDAKLLEFLYRKKYSDVTRAAGTSSLGPITHIKIIASAMGVREDVVEASLRHLEALSFVDELNQTWRVNAVCREFLRACYPELAHSYELGTQEGPRR
jgi:hypothetical protein